MECTEIIHRDNTLAMIARGTNMKERELLGRLLKAGLLNQRADEKRTAKKTKESPDDDGWLPVPVKYVAKDARLCAKDSLQSVSDATRRIISSPSWEFRMAGNATAQLLARACRGAPDIVCPSFEDISDDDVASVFEIHARPFGPDTTLMAWLRDEVAAIKHELERVHNVDFALILQREEAAVMRAVREALEAEPGVKIQTLLFDGVLVRECDEVQPEELLECINEAAGGVTFVQVPSECPEIEPLKPEEHIPLTDVDALRYVMTVVPDDVKRDGDVRMVYDRAIGMWAKESEGAFVNIMTHALLPLKLHTPYGTSRSKMNDVWCLMKSLPDSGLFFRRAREAIEGKLLFTNGVYDKMQGTKGARMDFSHELCFTKFVPHAMPDTEPTGVDEMRKFMFETPYPQPGYAAFLRQDLTRSVFGLNYGVAKFEIGPGSTGKSGRKQVAQVTFGDNVVSLNGNHLAVEGRNNPGAASPHLMPLQDARIAYVSEPGPTTMLDMSVIKMLTGGDMIACRALHRNMTQFTSRAHLHVLCNSIPPFSECQTSYMERRFLQLDTDVMFLEPKDYAERLKTRTEKELADDGVLKADPGLLKRCVANPQALIWIVMEEELMSDEEWAACIPDAVKVASRETLVERDDIKQLFERYYERGSADDHVHSEDIIRTLGLEGKGAPKQLSGRMQNWGYGKPGSVRVSGVTKNGYKGVKRKRCDANDGGAFGAPLWGAFVPMTGQV